MKNQIALTKHITIVISILIPFFISCQNNSKSEVKDKIPNELHYYVDESNTVEFAFVFPDTVYRNKIYNGQILYKGILDTINTQLAVGKDRRYLLYYYRLTNDITDNISSNEIVLDTVGATNNNTIPFYDIKFEKLGIYYIDGLIEDEVYMTPDENTEKVRVITHQTRATHKVVVIDDR
jgi:hypothetical protein